VKKSQKKTKNHLRNKFAMAEAACSIGLENSDDIWSEDITLVETAKVEVKNESETEVVLESVESIEEVVVPTPEIPVAVFLADNGPSYFSTITNGIKQFFTSKFKLENDTNKGVEATVSPIVVKDVKDLVIDAYINDLKSIFPVKMGAVEVDAGQFYSKNLLSTFTYATEFFSLIQKQMKFYQIMAGVEQVQINTTIEKNTINQVIDFELKNEVSTSWVMVFSRKIIPSIFKTLEKRDGTISGHHQFNLTKNTNCYTLIFSHNRIEEEVRVENQKTHTDLYTKPTLDL
jgi:hypothetical protein